MPAKKQRKTGGQITGEATVTIPETDTPMTNSGKPRKRKQADPNKAKGDVIINLLVDPLWGHIVKQGYEEHFGRYSSGNHDAVRTATPSLAYFVAPSIGYIQSRDYTGDQLMSEVENAFEYTTLKEGSVQISRECAEKILNPALLTMKGTYTRQDGFRWSARFVVLSAMYLYANFLIRNKRRETKYLRTESQALSSF